MGKWAVESWQTLHSELEALIVEGKHEFCRKGLDKINPKDIPRPWAHRFADLAFRTHFHLFSLKALRRHVHPENSFAKPASDREKMCYASALYSLGSIKESIEMLNGIDSAQEPESLFFRALAGFYEWRYAEGIPYLQQYISCENISHQRRLLGKINLAAAYVYECEWVEALRLLKEIEHESKAEDFRSFLGYCYELKSQVEIFQGRFTPGLEYLETARSLLKDQGGLYPLFVDKWIAVATCLRAPTSENLQRLNELRLRARDSGHWETVRECDLFEAIATENENLAKKVVMGSPFEPYRARVRRLTGRNVKPLGQFALLLSAADADPEVVPLFDSYQSGLHEKKRLLEVYDALTQDFYKPCSLGTLFQHIYSGEQFNPFSSPPRVLQSLKRLDRWFFENNVPLKVVLKKSEFSLTSTAPIQVLIQRGRKLSVLDGNLSNLKSLFEDRTFTSAQASKELGVSKFTAQRILNDALKEGKLIQMGRGRSTIYRFVSRGRKAKAA